MLRRAAVGGAEHDFLLVERFATQHLGRRHFAARQPGDAVGAVADAQFLDVADGDAVLVAEQFFFSSRRRHTRWTGDWSSDVCSSDLWECVTWLAAVGRFEIWIHYSS